MSTDAAPRSVFLISPIGDEGSDLHKAAGIVKKYLVQAAFPAPDFLVERADDSKNPGHITPRIIASIRSADLVIIDLTDCNPNVFYEMAVAHGYGKPIVHIMRKGQKPPFDVNDINTIFYETTDPEELERAVLRLHEMGTEALTHPSDIQTPLSDAGLFLALESGDNPAHVVLNEIREDVRYLREEMNARSAREQLPWLTFLTRPDSDIPAREDQLRQESLKRRLVDMDRTARGARLANPDDHTVFYGRTRGLGREGQVEEDSTSEHGAEQED